MYLLILTGIFLLNILSLSLLGIGENGGGRFQWTCSSNASKFDVNRARQELAMQIINLLLLLSFGRHIVMILIIIKYTLLGPHSILIFAIFI